jgi:hypothetical protein
VNNKHPLHFTSLHFLSFATTTLVLQQIIVHTKHPEPKKASQKFWCAIGLAACPIKISSKDCLSFFWVTYRKKIYVV